jgi:hypothetical protein
MSSYRIRPTELDLALESDPRARAAHQALLNAACADEAGTGVDAQAEPPGDGHAVNAEA